MNGSSLSTTNVSDRSWLIDRHCYQFYQTFNATDQVGGDARGGSVAFSRNCPAMTQSSCPRCLLTQIDVPLAHHQHERFCALEGFV